MKTLILLVVLSIALLGSCGQSPATTPEPPPTSPPLPIADFDSCSGVNLLGGQSGGAYNSPDLLQETYVQDLDRGCVARLRYEVEEWAAFWIQLMGADLTPYRQLAFDVRAEGEPPRRAKLELKNQAGEVGILYIEGIGTEWNTMTVSLADFTAGYGKPLSSLRNMAELVLVFEASQSGPEGIVYLDNVRFQ